MLDVLRKLVGGLITARPVLLQRLHHIPVKVAAHLADQLRRLGMTMLGHARQVCCHHCARSGRWANRFLVADHAPDFVESCLEEFAGIKRRRAGQQLVKQHPQALNVSPRIDIHPGWRGLFRTHICGRANQHLE